MNQHGGQTSVHHEDSSSLKFVVQGHDRIPQPFLGDEFGKAGGLLHASTVLNLSSSLKRSNTVKRITRGTFRPAPVLATSRPTSSLFSGFTVPCSDKFSRICHFATCTGLQTRICACEDKQQVLSVVGMLGLNALFLEVNWNIITSDDEYVPFPATCLIAV